ncbi:MAG: sugar transferase [Deinococcota bacterium]
MTHPRAFLKRSLDIVLSATALVILAPLLLLLWLLIARRLGRPVLFLQQRPGRDGASFTIIKFRSMTDAKDKQGQLLPDVERLTQFGQLLRRLSLDELPELINVIRGDMSLVGPRPLLVQYLDRYTPEQARRHDMRPGITGWAQVNGRNALSWEEKFAFDVWYVDNWTLWLDAKILWLTVYKVFKREGISAAGSATMPEFMGTPSQAPSDASANTSAPELDNL